MRAIFCVLLAIYFIFIAKPMHPNAQPPKTVMGFCALLSFISAAVGIVLAVIGI